VYLTNQEAVPTGMPLVARQKRRNTGQRAAQRADPGVSPVAIAGCVR
jgi:hypothetical protein